MGRKQGSSRNGLEERPVSDGGAVHSRAKIEEKRAKKKDDLCRGHPCVNRCRLIYLETEIIISNLTQKSNSKKRPKKSGK